MTESVLWLVGVSLVAENFKQFPSLRVDIHELS